MMYLVTIEQEDGMWFEDPAAFDTKKDAFEYADKQDMPDGVCAVIYECHQLTEVPSTLK